MTDSLSAGSATIGNLPVELLRRVFYLAEQGHATYSLSYCDPGLPAIPISQVSRHWRSIAIAYQELWASWPRYGPFSSWTTICHKRSLNVPLNLHICLDYGSSDGTKAKANCLAIQQLSRAQELWINIAEVPYSDDDPNIYVDNICKLRTLAPLNVKAPALRYLSIHDPFRALSQNPIPLFSDGALPCSLRHIHSGDIVPLSYDRIRSDYLCVLHLDATSPWRDIDELLAFFSNMPNLEEIRYSADSDGFLDTPYTFERHPTVRTVPLSRLRQLTLSGEFARSIPVFIYCVFPLTTILDLTGMIIVEVPHSCAAELFAQALRDHFAAASARGQGYDILKINGCTLTTLLDEKKKTRFTVLPSKFAFGLRTVGYATIDARAFLKMVWAAYFSLPIFLNISVVRVESQPELHTTERNAFPASPGRPIIDSRWQLCS